MEFTCNLDAVMSAFNASKAEICDAWGTLLVAEYQNRTPVVTGIMRANETFETMDNNSGINIGATVEAPYAVYVECGSSKQTAQHILENTVMDNVGTLESIANEKISSHLG